MVTRLHLTVALVLLSAAVASGGATRAVPHSPDATPALGRAGCPVTTPGGVVPPGSGNPEYVGWYGNDALATNVWMWGEDGVRLGALDDHVRPDGSLAELKWAWYRYTSGDLRVQRRRLDGPAGPLLARIPAGYGDRGFQVTGITFPSAGCWEITGSVGPNSLTFVVWVEILLAATPAGFPPSSPR